MKASRIVSSSLSALLIVVFSGAPDALAQQPTTDQAPQSRGVSVDPSQPPLAPSNAPLPDAPSQQQQSAPAQQPSTTLTQQPTPQAPAQTQQQSQQPLGTAAAEQVRTAGGAASRPAGAALAPARQKQSRSLLIKTGAILAAGIAVGTIYGLSRGTSSVPPNSGRK
jgi:type IV secretory pathway VirB10-like protein